MPEYRTPVSYADPSESSQYHSAYGIQSSMEGTDGVPVPTMFRIADPFFYAPLSSLVSSLVSNYVSPPITVTK
jgi:hypothetical protein